MALTADTGRHGGQFNSYWQKKVAEKTYGSMGGLPNVAFQPLGVRLPSSDAASPSQCHMNQ